MKSTERGRSKPQADTKKTLYLQERTLIDGLVSDEADATRRFESAVYEGHLLKSLMPQNSQAAFFVRTLRATGLQAAFRDAFDYLAAGIGWKASQSNTRPLVEHFRSTCTHALAPSGSEPQFPYCIARFEAIIGLLESRLDSADPLSELRENVQFAKELLHELEAEPEFSRFVNFTSLILSNWDLLGTHTYTFRFLTAVASVQEGIRDTPESRYQFVQILREISPAWQT
jgi:hypothetical protein